MKMRRSKITIAAMIVAVALAGCGGDSDSDNNPPRVVSTASEIELSATAFVAGATQTAAFIATNPAAVASEEPFIPAQAEAASCTPGAEYNRVMGDLSRRAQAAVENAGVNNPAVSVISTERSQDCVSSQIFNLLIAVNVDVPNLNDAEALGNLTAQIASALPAALEGQVSNFQPVTVSFRFDQGSSQRKIDAKYPAIQTALAGNLRGAALVDALGGLHSG
jgi:hypothetical protein